MSENPYTKKEQSLKYKAFALLYKKFQLPLMKFIIKKMGGNTLAAEEIFSQTVEAGLKGYYKFENKSSYFTWICRIALNKIADYYRDQINQRSKIITPLFKELASIEDTKNLTPEERVLILELRESLRSCLDLLPAEKRELLQMKYWKEFSNQKIGEILGISERAAEGKLYRARLELKTIVVKKYPDLVGFKSF